MLNKYSIEEWKIILKDSKNPYGNIKDRKFWNNISKELREFLIGQGEKYLNFDYSVLTYSMYNEFSKNGNRINFQLPYFKRRKALFNLVVAECVENQGRFIKDIVDILCCICEEFTWVVPAHCNDLGNEYIDLFSAETGSTLAWSYYLMKDSLQDEYGKVLDIVKKKLEDRILSPYEKHNEFWWMGYGKNKVNNWNPWINSNIASIILCIEDDEDRKADLLYKVNESIDFFVNGYSDDGGCDEGPHYWNRAAASLFDYLELLYIFTEGKINFYNEKLIKNMGIYMTKVHIDGEKFLPFSDTPCNIPIEPLVIYRYGKRINDKELMTLGQSVIALYGMSSITKGEFHTPNRFIQNVLAYDSLESEASFKLSKEDVFLPNLEVAKFWSSSKKLCLAIKGGNNDESHNHNDIGEFVVYLNGEPFIIDAGVGTYTAKTFSDKRYEIWTMRSAYHNVPMINGYEQNAGKMFKANNTKLINDKKIKGMSLDLEKAYPKECEIKEWNREVLIDEETIIITDSFAFLGEKSDFEFVMLTPYAPKLVNESILLRNEKDTLKIDFGHELKASFEEVIIDDKKLKDQWGDKIFKLYLKPTLIRKSGILQLKIYSDFR